MNSVAVVVHWNQEGDRVQWGSMKKRRRRERNPCRRDTHADVVESKWKSIFADDDDIQIGMYKDE